MPSSGRSTMAVFDEDKALFETLRDESGMGTAQYFHLLLEHEKQIRGGDLPEEEALTAADRTTLEELQKKVTEILAQYRTMEGKLEDVRCGMEKIVEDKILELQAKGKIPGPLPDVMKMSAEELHRYFLDHPDNMTEEERRRTRFLGAMEYYEEGQGGR